MFPIVKPDILTVCLLVNTPKFDKANNTFTIALSDIRCATGNPSAVYTTGANVPCIVSPNSTNIDATLAVEYAPGIK